MKLFNPPRLTGKYLPDVLASGHLTSGPENGRLKDVLGRFLNVDPKRIALAASATAAFQAILDLLAQEEVCGVCITRSTWPGCLQAITHAGLELRSDGIRVETDIGGRRWYEPGSGEPYVIDASHSWVYQPARFWFASAYPSKLVPAAEGAAIVCREESDREVLEWYLYCGLRPGAAGNGETPRVCGRKSNLPDTQAALMREALELAPAHIEETAAAWCDLAARADYLGVPYRDQPVRPYLFQVEVPTKGLTTVSPIPWCMMMLKQKGIPSAWNFRPAPLLTIPCHAGADPRRVMEAVAEVLGL